MAGGGWGVMMGRVLDETTAAITLLMNWHPKAKK